jgi:undecaprenyl-diphosphatase
MTDPHPGPRPHSPAPAPAPACNPDAGGLTHDLKRAAARFDAAVDGVFARHLRGHKVVDRIFYGASAAGDHSAIWVALAVAQAARQHRGRRRVEQVAVGLLAESLLVNGPIKWVFRRERPVAEEPRPLHLRQPRTSSFPSGHATAAFFAAAILRDDDPLWPAYYALAVIVAASRVHVKIHHASDVVGGALLGALLGELTRQLVPIQPLPAPLPHLTLVEDGGPDDGPEESLEPPRR